MNNEVINDRLEYIDTMSPSDKGLNIGLNIIYGSIGALEKAIYENNIFQKAVSTWNGINSFTNCRIKHLAYRGKSFRVRKKNVNRLRNIIEGRMR